MELIVNTIFRMIFLSCVKIILDMATKMLIFVIPLGSHCDVIEKEPGNPGSGTTPPSVSSVTLGHSLHLSES